MILLISYMIHIIVLCRVGVDRVGAPVGWWLGGSKGPRGLNKGLIGPWRGSIIIDELNCIRDKVPRYLLINLSYDSTYRAYFT